MVSISQRDSQQNTLHILTQSILVAYLSRKIALASFISELHSSVNFQYMRKKKIPREEQ